MHGGIRISRSLDDLRRVAQLLEQDQSGFLAAREAEEVQNALAGRKLYLVEPVRGDELIAVGAVFEYDDGLRRELGSLFVEERYRGLALAQAMVQIMTVNEALSDPDFDDLFGCVDEANLGWTHALGWSPWKDVPPELMTEKDRRHGQKPSRLYFRAPNDQAARSFEWLLERALLTDHPLPRGWVDRFTRTKVEDRFELDLTTRGRSLHLALGLSLSMRALATGRGP